MNPSRSVILALSAALIFLAGSSASTVTANYSHPEFSVAGKRTLNLRETGSQIVAETIETALRAGGLALLGEGFQLDSSLSYHSGDNEGIEGGLDVVVPLWDGGRHAVFAQPGAVFWTGLEEEERIDGNIGLVYRAELTGDLVAGASVFYDHNFQIGHSRVSGGIDLQSRFFRLGANYYHPLGEEEDGREGFVEEALRGMDARLVFEREVVRLGSTIGYWEYDGGEDVEDDWKTSIGLDAGVRILPGVFAEASWERHKDDLVLDERVFAGLAFKFSLPDFHGASYGDGSMSANLYKIVDREKRILYEEREADGILFLPDGSVAEGGTVNVSVRLRKPSAEDVVINLVGSGSATYGDDYTVSVGGTDCTGVTGTSCSITIVAGETVPSGNVVIAINDDGGGESAETIILSTVIASGDASLTSRPLVLTIPADPPLPTVSLSADSTSIAEGNTATITLALSGTLESDATFNLIGSSDNNDVTYGASNDWNLSIDGADCADATESSPCRVMISRGDTFAEVTVEVNANSPAEPAEDFSVSVVVDSGSTNLVMLGGSSSLGFTIESAPTVSLIFSGNTTIPENDLTYPVTIQLSSVLTQDITVNLVQSGGSATHGSPGDAGDYRILRLGSADCPGITGSMCQFTIRAGETSIDATLVVWIDFLSEPPEDMTLSIVIDQASQNLVVPGSNTSVRFEITSRT